MNKSGLRSLLSRVGALIGIDATYTLRNSSWLIAEQALSVAAGAVLAIAFANLLPKDAYGTYRFVLSIAAILTAFALPGMSTALTRAIARGSYAAYPAAFKARVRWGTLALIGGFIVAIYYWGAGNHELAIAIGIASLFLPFFDALSMYNAYWAGIRRFDYSALADTAARVGSILLMLGTLLLSKDPIVIVASYFVSNTLLRGVFFLLAGRAAARHSAAPVDSDLAHYGWHLSILYVIGSASSNVDQIALFHFTGAAAVAAYALATLVPDQVRAFVKNFSTIAFPKYAARSFQEIRATLPQRTLIVAAFTLLVGITYVLLAPLLFSILFPRYPEAVFATQLMSLSLIDTLTLLPLSALKAHRMTATLYRYNIVSGLLFIVGVTAGAAVGGLVGTIAGYVIARLLGTSYLFLLLYRPLES